MKTGDKIIIKRRGDDGYRVFSVRVREDVVAKIDTIAKDTGRSRNEIIGMLLEFAVDRCSIFTEPHSFSSITVRNLIQVN